MLAATIETRNHLPRSSRVQSCKSAGLALRGLALLFYDGTPATEYDRGPFRSRRLPGCLDRWFAEVEAGERVVQCLDSHDPGRVLGTTEDGSLRIWLDARGLNYECALNETWLARDIAERVRSGEVGGSSCLTFTREDRWYFERGAVIQEVRTVAEVVEVGPHANPVNALSSAALINDPVPSHLRNRAARLIANREARLPSGAAPEVLRGCLADARARHAAKVADLPLHEARRDFERDPRRRRCLEILLGCERIEIDETGRALDRLEVLVL